MAALKVSLSAEGLQAIRKRLAEAFVEPEAIDFKGMMAVAEGRDPITALMVETRKADRAGLLDRIEGMGWRLLTANRLRDAYRADITRLLAELGSRDQRIRDAEKAMKAFDEATSLLWLLSENDPNANMALRREVAEDFLAEHRPVNPNVTSIG